MDMNGKDDLNSPLLQNRDDVVVTISNEDRRSREKTRTLVFKVVGITCASCVASIESALQRVDGVQSVMVSVLQGRAVVKYVPEIIAVSQLQFFGLCYVELVFCVCELERFWIVSVRSLF